MSKKNIDTLLKETLGTNTWKCTSGASGGCINEGESYLTDSGTVFVKRNAKNGARQMFDGEYAALLAMEATKTVRVPHPIAVVDNPGGGAALIMEHLDLRGLNRCARQLGEQLARMHLHNETRAGIEGSSSVHTKRDDEDPYIQAFGFHVTTCCGFLSQNNEWCKTWPEFFARQRLDHQIQLLTKEYGDRNLIESWSLLQLKIPSFFTNDMVIQPALLHGDLWSGNIGETGDTCVIYDPASFYGHYEYEFGIATMFGGFNRQFFDGYYSVRPKEDGHEKRLKLYQLFHHLNHWNHFGTGYKRSSMSLMQQLCAT